MEIRIILGAPCSGKGSQCFLLRDLATHISAGEILRKRYPPGSETRKILDEGNLISTDLMNQLIQEEIENSKAEKILIDGYPRNVAQAFFLREFPIHSVLYLHVNKKIACARMNNRESCQKCGRTYSSHILCCQETTKRSDDNMQSFERRFEIFQKEILEIFTILSCPIYFINAEEQMNEISKKIRRIIISG